MPFYPFGNDARNWPDKKEYEKELSEFNAKARTSRIADAVSEYPWRGYGLGLISKETLNISIENRYLLRSTLDAIKYKLAGEKVEAHTKESKTQETKPKEKPKKVETKQPSKEEVKRKSQSTRSAILRRAQKDAAKTGIPLYITMRKRRRR